MSKILNIGIPSKGRLRKDILNIFIKNKLTLVSERGERDLIGSIKQHKNIKILLETVSGYDLVKYFDITVTGICTSGNVLAIWTGDQRISSDSSKFLANIIAYTDSAIDNCGRNNNQDCTAENNYEFVLIYFVLLKKKYPFFLIDKNINKKNLKNLIKKFSPNYILSKEKKLLNLKLSKQLLNFNIFNNSNKNYNINKNLCLLLPTSGSTGSPKFVMLSRQNILKNTKDICRYLKLNKNNITNLKIII